MENFKGLGVNSIYPWQSTCLLGPGLLTGEENLVYVAPTGGGKSLVSDVLMLKRIIEQPGKKGILVLPYVALVHEKLQWLRRLVAGVARKPLPDALSQSKSLWRGRGKDSIRVTGLVGGSRTRFSRQDTDIAVCTIEKANALINDAVMDGTAGDIGCVVLDELHMINDDSRGYILELLATKLLCLNHGGEGAQIVGMSATLPNADVLAKWLGGKFYISRYSPVPIEEYLVFDGGIYPASTAKEFYRTAAQLADQKERTEEPTQTRSQVERGRPEPVRLISPSQHPELKSSLLNEVVSLATETALSGYGVLVFCSSRAGCESDALIISQALPEPTPSSTPDPCSITERRAELLSELRSSATGLDPTLERTVLHGVAFHHAGLTIEEREIVTCAYDSGVLKVIVATCSLSAGINLPARRVILHGARMGRDLVAPSMLRQMRGRAGRKGKDEVGETYLCCAKSDLEEVAELMGAELPDVESCLAPEKRGIERALLEVIATRLATSTDDIQHYVKKTLLYHLTPRADMGPMIRNTVDKLIQQELIKLNGWGVYEPTMLGGTIVASSLTPEDGIFIHRQLERAIRGFALDGDMHVLYTFTPIQNTMVEVNWKVFRQEIEKLDEPSVRVLGLVGIKPSLINKLAFGGQLLDKSAEEQETARVYRRFYAALQLRDLCNEMPVYQVAKKYSIPRGAVQNLARACHGFAAGLVKFCERMGWGALAAALDHMSDRLKAGAKSDLLALAKVTFVKSRTARIFWDNGLKSVGRLAESSVEEIMAVLVLAQPKKLRLDGDDEEKYQRKLKVKAEIVQKSAHNIWEAECRAEAEEGLEGME